MTRIITLLLVALSLLGATAAPERALLEPTTSGQSGSSAIGTSLEAGVATWCAPTPDYCQSWGGDAMLGAVPSFRYGDDPYLATVCHAERCVTVTVVSFCDCGYRNGRATVIDLSPAAFSRLADLDRGVIEVTVERGGSPELPQTDVAPGYKP